jgi:hypothetical protein
MSVRLDHDGIRDILKSQPVADAVHELASKIASAVAGETGADVVVDDYTTDRAASSVTIRDAAGKLWQVRDGVLTKAAAAEGLEVTEQ